MYSSDTVETASLANSQITSDFDGKHWKISDANQNAVWSLKNTRDWNECTTNHKAKQYTNDHNTQQYTTDNKTKKHQWSQHQTARH